MNKINVLPGSTLNGEIVIPSSKPHIQRALLLALLNEEKTTINNLSWCTETEDLLTALQQFGLKILDRSQNHITLKGAHPIYHCNGIIHANGSGMLFRISVALASLTEKEVYIKCNDSLFNRESLYDEAFFSYLNVFAEKQQENIVVISRRIYPSQSPLNFNKSTQFLSFSLLVSPFIKGKSIIINNDSETKNGYVDITIKMMASLGSKITRIGNAFISTKYQARDIIINIPTDFTSLSYIASSILSINRPSKVTIKRYSLGNTINEGVLFNIYKRFGINLKYNSTKNELNINLARERNAITGEIYLNELPSVATNIIAAAINGKGNITFSGLNAINNHKCQRAFIINENIRMMGGKSYLIFNDTGAFNKIMIHSNGPLNGGVEVFSYYDHRICASNIIASLGARERTTVNNINKLDDGFPGFIQSLSSLGARIS
ncbi:3-phosphoshikimate 1-carboxyvinyltransferase [Photorhabdus tasmaniensis]|uniref:3-phosphoshikimate 1-carboxyvinyltransferase n=1 Tax=Photorhabdus tasmaniensis TaxID=1004159 RepID=UPI0040424F3D